MAGEVDLRTFSGGMNRDLDQSVIPANVYVDALNFKLVADEDGNGFTLENAEGNTDWFTLSSVSGLDSSYYIAGHKFIQPYLVLFVTQNENELSFSTGLSGIVLITLHNGKIQNKELVYIDSASKGYLNFSTALPITAVGVYESETIVKVYWTDSYNELRYMNVVDPDLNTYNIGVFSFTPKYPDLSAASNPARITFEELVGGNLLASAIQYTYQYYSANGSATAFAPLTPPILIPKDSRTGGEQDEQTGHGVKLSLTMPSAKIYDRIRLVALDFSSFSAVPTVRVFGEYAIDLNDTKTVFYYFDIGDTINEIAYEDFLVFGNVTYKAKAIETKDSQLFIGNLVEDVFDVTSFDARAYRHNSSGVARLYESDLTTYIDVDDDQSSGGGISYSSVPTTHDCINRYNDPTLETNSAYAYKYRADGTTIGASGPNVSISLTNSSSHGEIDLVGTTAPSTVGRRATNSPSDPSNAAYYRSFQRQEVYRFGIVFYNQKMQASPVKWICDFKMPIYNETDAGNDFNFVYVNATETYANILGVQVAINNMPSEAFAWQVVMVPRSANDRTVMANGVLQVPRATSVGTYYVYPSSDYTSGSSSTPGLTPNEGFYSPSGYDSSVHLMYSPDIVYTQSLGYKDGDFLQYIGYFNYVEATNTEVNSTLGWYNVKLYDFVADGDYNTSEHKDIDDFAIVAQNADTDTKTQVGTKLYSNFATNGAGDFEGLHGTVGVLDMSAALAPGTSTSRIPVGSYRRNVFESQYGGIDYYSRERNEYIAISDVRYTNGTIVTYEGDVFIEMFAYLRLAKDLNDNSTYMSYVMFPIESSLSSYYDNTEHYILRAGIPSIESTFQRESAGTWVGSISSTDYTFEQKDDLYQYNSVYSIRGVGRKFYTSLLDESQTEYYPTRTRVSDVKQLEEIQDSFTIFRASNYKDVEGEHGDINNLFAFKNQLHFWQDTAFGVLSVNTRSLIQDNNPGVLALGTGGVLDRYDYISESSGNVNPQGIVKSNKYLYWVDNNKNEIVRYSGDLSTLSKTSGVQTLLNEKGTVGIAKGVYDTKYNDVIFTLKFSRDAQAVTASGGFVNDLYIDDTGLSSSTYYPATIPAAYEESKSLYGANNVLYYDGIDFSTSTALYGNNTAEYDVTFDLPNYDGDETLTFNEQIGKFVSRASFKPMSYVQLDNNYLSTIDLQKLWLHNSGGPTKRANYYNTSYDSTLTVTFNKEYPYTKVYDNIKWITEAVDGNGVNQFKETFKQVEMYNDYQHTGKRDLYYQHDTPSGTLPVPVSRRERTWSMHIPRNIVDTNVELNPDIFDSANWDSTQLYKERMRDKYLTVKLYYDNTSFNDVLSTSLIATTYRKSFR